MAGKCYRPQRHGICTLESGTPSPLSPPSSSDIGSLTYAPSGGRLENLTGSVANPEEEPPDSDTQGPGGKELNLRAVT